MQALFDLEKTSYWLLLIWVFAAGILLDKLPKKQELVCGRMRERWHWFTALVLVTPYILWTGYRSGGADTSAYAGAFRSVSASIASIPAVLTSGGKDPGFTALMILAKALGIRDYQHFFLLIAAVQMLCMVHTFRRYSPNFWFSIFLFVASTDYMSWMQNGMRQFIAVCMTFGAFDLLVQRRYGRFALIVLIAMQIHASSVIMLPLAFIMQGRPMNYKTWMAILVAILCVPFIDRITPVLEKMMSDTQYGDVMSNEIWLADNGTNVIRVFVYSIPALLVLVFRRHVVRANDPVINQCINASILTMAMYLISMVTSGIYVGRLPIYTTLHGYMVLPWMLDRIFEKPSARLLKFLMIACYVAFFYYQMHFVWGFL